MIAWLLIFLTVIPFIVVHGSTADNTWTKSSSAPATNWASISSDSSGARLIASSAQTGNNMTGIYLSSDYGSSWKNVFINGAAAYETWQGVCSTVDGSTMYAMQQNMGVYVSNNGGSYWDHYPVDKAITYASYVMGCASQQGNYVASAIYGGGIYTSNNYGRTFTKSSAPFDTWMFVSVSPSGQYMLAGSSNLYLSTNYGSTWTKTTAPAANWWNAYFSTDGMHIVAAAEGNAYSNYAYGGIYMSTDGGKTWKASTTANKSLKWRYATSDSTGQHITAVVSGGGLYYSDDFGVTFTQSSSAPSSASWKAVTSDASGKFLTAITSGSDSGSIYTTH